MTAEAPAHSGPVTRSEDAADRPWWRTIPTAPWWRIPLYPAAFLSAFVLVSWAGGGIPVMMLARPLVVAIGLPLGLTAILAAILRDRDRAAIIATAVTLILLTSDDRTAIALGIVTVVLVAEGLLHRGRPQWMAALATRVLSGVGLVVVVAALIADRPGRRHPEPHRRPHRAIACAGRGRARRVDAGRVRLPPGCLSR